MIQITINRHTITVEDSERQEVEVWSRVMGYYRPVEDWNIGKQQEFRDRKYFRENTMQMVI